MGSNGNLPVHTYAHIEVHNLGMGPINEGEVMVHDIPIRERARILTAQMTPTGRFFLLIGEERIYEEA
jgi:hypothetical protein